MLAHRLDRRMSKLNQFTALSLRHKILLAQAWFMLGGYRAATLCISFKRLTKKLHHQKTAVVPVDISSCQLLEAQAIGRLVAAASTVTPWQSPCLAQVLLVQRLLARRHIPGQFFLGVRRVDTPPGASGGLSAHAWLQCAHEIVNGAGEHEHFTVVSSFSWGKAQH